jgi:hypothetical protein
MPMKASSMMMASPKAITLSGPSRSRPPSVGAKTAAVFFIRLSRPPPVAWIM